MSRVKKIVTSEIEGRNLGDFYGDNSYSFDIDGQINYYGENKMGPVIEPGIVYGSNADSGDGYGYNTIKLVPHSPDGYINDDRYLIIDPTAPNHIHIRAGGIQDGSNAQLFLGAEKNHVRIDDNNKEVVISSKQSQTVQAVLNVNFESNEYLVFNDVVPITAYSGWYTEVNSIRFYVNEVSYPTEGQTLAYFPGAPFISQGVYNLFSPEETNEWQFNSNGTIYGPGESSVVKVTGIENATGSNSLSVTSSGSMTVNAAGGDMNFYMDGGMYIGNSDSTNQIIKRSDLDSYVSPAMVRYQPTFAATGLTFTGSGETYPTYNSYYTKAGKIVSFVIEVDLSTVTNFGTGQYTLELPFDPAIGYNHFSGWAQVDTNVNPDVPNGHVVLNVDHAGITSTLDLHYLKQAGGAHTPIIEGLFLQGTPVTLTTASKIYVNGTYIAA